MLTGKRSLHYPSLRIFLAKWDKNILRCKIVLRSWEKYHKLIIQLLRHLTCVWSFIFGGWIVCFIGLVKTFAYNLRFWHSLCPRNHNDMYFQIIITCVPKICFIHIFSSSFLFRFFVLRRDFLFRIQTLFRCSLYIWNRVDVYFWIMLLFI